VICFEPHLGARRVSLWLLFVTVIVTQLSACVSSPPRAWIQSSRLPDVVIDPKRLIVLSEVGGEFGQEYANGFENQLGLALKDCGFEVNVERVYSVPPNDRVMNRMKEFAPDSTLTIRRTGGTAYVGGSLFHAVYDAKLYDATGTTLVWRASIGMSRESAKSWTAAGMTKLLTELGETLALDLASKLKADQIFRSCGSVKQSAK
jgi:hypothetical protein